jgi:hypothetical protein
MFSLYYVLIFNSKCSKKSNLNIVIGNEYRAFLMAGNSKNVASAVQIKVEVYKRRIIYMVKDSANRISYNRVKKALVKTNKTIFIEVPNWLLECPLKRPL